MLAVLLTLALASPTPTPAWKSVHTGIYQFEVRAGETKVLTVPLPPSLAGGTLPMTFTWTVVRPTPPPMRTLLEQCDAPERCRPILLRPTGTASGTVRSTFRLTNRSGRDVAIRFQYTVWDRP